VHIELASAIYPGLQLQICYQTWEHL
jgi:hypothetical protein